MGPAIGLWESIVDVGVDMSLGPSMRLTVLSNEEKGIRPLARKAV
jgi:hypothetical protein